MSSFTDIKSPIFKASLEFAEEITFTKPMEGSDSYVFLEEISMDSDSLKEAAFGEGFESIEYWDMKSASRWVCVVDENTQWEYNSKPTAFLKKKVKK